MLLFVNKSGSESCDADTVDERTAFSMYPVLAATDSGVVLIAVLLLTGGLGGRAALVRQQVADGRMRNYFFVDTMTLLAILLLLGLVGQMFRGRWP